MHTKHKPEPHACSVLAHTHFDKLRIILEFGEFIWGWFCQSALFVFWVWAPVCLSMFVDFDSPVFGFGRMGGQWRKVVLALSMWWFVRAFWMCIACVSTWHRCRHWNATETRNICVYEGGYDKYWMFTGQEAFPDRKCWCHHVAPSLQQWVSTFPTDLSSIFVLDAVESFRFFVFGAILKNKQRRSVTFDDYHLVSVEWIYELDEKRSGRPMEVGL